MRYNANYSDGLAQTPMVRAVPMLVDWYATSYPVARAVMLACKAAHAAGLAGEDYEKPIATRDVAELVHDAWHDGIVARKLTVRLVSSELQCTQCGCMYLDANDTYCPGCETGEWIGRNVTADVSAPYADVWADWDQSIAGSNWETPPDMPHYAYTCLIDHPGLVAELRAEGYTLNLSEYEGEC